ncbi:MAG: class I SAM-dependent methyltransferase [Isosphaeraceae bacterium]
MTKIQVSREWAQFERDAANYEGYVYTTNPSLSSRMASLRHSDAIHDALDFRGKSVIDIGCGDGTYSIELFDRGRPSSIYALDPAAKAIAIARRKTGGRNITFEAASAYEIPRDDDTFDIAHLRGVLHHMDRPYDAIREAFRVATTIILLEPNGYNMGLKLIERASRYHRDHGEKSYPPVRLDRWVERLGGTVTRRNWVCLVPYFCPDWLARSMKRAEPIVESIPLFNRLGCSTYIMLATRRG